MKRVRTPQRIILGIMLLGSILATSFWGDWTMALSAPKNGPPADPDGRSYFVGNWFCEGKRQLGLESPLVVTMRGSFDLDGAWLGSRFDETSQPPPGQAPIREWQYWTYTKETNRHTRLIFENLGGYATVTSPGWEGNAIHWRGPYTTSGLNLVFIESLIKHSSTSFQNKGHAETSTGQIVLTFDILCRKQS